MGLSLAKWIADVDGHYLDIDAAFGAQCHDLWLDYGYRVVGMGQGQGWAPGNGDTVNVLTGFPAVRGLDAHFTRHWGIGGIRAGDVAFWYRSAWFPGTHVAIALGPPVGELLPTMTQNPGPSRGANLITRGFAGYLRPINASGAGLAQPGRDQALEGAAMKYVKSPNRPLTLIGEQIAITVRHDVDSVVKSGLPLVEYKHDHEVDTEVREAHRRGGWLRQQQAMVTVTAMRAAGLPVKVDIDEEALAAALVESIAGTLAMLPTADVERIAIAAADETDRRDRERLKK